MFEKFPKVLLVDGTYNVDAIRMPLYCLMAEDGFGKGRVIFYTAVCEEDATHLQKMHIWLSCSRSQIQNGIPFV